MSCGYQVSYYTDSRGVSPVKEFIDSLQLRARVKVLRIFELIESYGIESVIPHTKKLKGYPIWEMRLHGKDSIRLFYIVYKESSILILHGFYKKSSRSPRKEIQVALNRYASLDI